MKFPTAFEQYTKALMGEELYANFKRSMQQEPTAFIRLNYYKNNLAHIIMPATQVAWYKYGYALKVRPTFTFDPLWHAGLYYVQEQSSMFLAQIINQLVHQPVKMLDMCASPGGKSTLARIELPKGSTLICNEPIPLRAQILAENVQRCGHPEVIVTNNYPKDFHRAGLKFDIILCDVPCSGEGMFRKNTSAIDEWSIENVNKCQQLQREIVAEAWQCLNPGGILIYSTCTFNTKENEENVEWICNKLGAKTIEINVKEEWNIEKELITIPKSLSHNPSTKEGGVIKSCANTHSSNVPNYNVQSIHRFIPGYHYSPNNIYGEGLFMVALRKEGNQKNTKDKSNKNKSYNKQKQHQVIYPTHWLQQAENFQFEKTDNLLIAIPHTLHSQYLQAARSLHILSAGIPLCTQKGKNLIPTEALALSTHLATNAFPHIDLSYNNALHYLCRNTLTLPTNAPQGYVLVTYQNVPLGFIKNMGYRANNLYPNEWRIRTTHLPKDEEVVKIVKA